MSLGDFTSSVLSCVGDASYSKKTFFVAHLQRVTHAAPSAVFLQKARSTLATMSKQRSTLSKQHSTLSKGRNFNAKLVRHCCRFWQQSRTLLRHCCWCGPGLILCFHQWSFLHARRYASSLFIMLSSCDCPFVRLSVRHTHSIVSKRLNIGSRKSNPTMLQGV